MPSATKKGKSKRKEQVTSEPRMICSMEVGGGAYRPGSISWSTTGQAVVVLDAVIHIFVSLSCSRCCLDSFSYLWSASSHSLQTPSLGFHPNLKPNARMNTHQLPTSDPFDLPASSGTQLHSDDSIDPFDHYHWALDIGHEVTEGNHRDIVANGKLEKFDLSSFSALFVLFSQPDALLSFYKSIRFASLVSQTRFWGSLLLLLLDGETLVGHLLALDPTKG